MDTHQSVSDALLPYLVAMCGLRDSDQQGCWACEATLSCSRSSRAEEQLMRTSRIGAGCNKRCPPGIDGAYGI